MINHVVTTSNLDKVQIHGTAEKLAKGMADDFHLIFSFIRGGNLGLRIGNGLYKIVPKRCVSLLRY